MDHGECLGQTNLPGDQGASHVRSVNRLKRHDGEEHVFVVKTGELLGDRFNILPLIRNRAPAMG